MNDHAMHSTLNTQDTSDTGVLPNTPIRIVVDQNAAARTPHRHRVEFSPLQSLVILSSLALVVGLSIWAVRMVRKHRRNAATAAADRAFATLAKAARLDASMQSAIKTVATELDLPALGLLVCPAALRVAIEQSPATLSNRQRKKLISRLD